MAETPPSLAPLPFRMLVDRAMHDTRHGLRTLWWPFALPLAVLGGLIGVAAVLFNTGFISLMEDGPPAFAVLGLSIGAVILLGLVMGYVYAALFAAVVRTAARHPAPLRGIWSLCLQPRFFGTLVLVGLCSIAGFLLCFFPALWVGLVLAFVLPVMVDEDVYGTAALKRSYALVRYNPHRRFLDNPMVKVFLLLIIGWVLSYVVSMILTLPFSVVQQVMIFRDAASGDTEVAASATRWLWLSVPAQVLGALGSAAVQIYLFFGLSLLFFDCRRRKEGQDLEDAVALLEGLHPPEPAETA